MKTTIKKIWGWLKESDRYKHLGGGIILGIGAESLFCAAYTSVGVASALEYKDKAWGGEWDWIDWSLTIAGAFIGLGVRALIGLSIAL